MALKKLSIHVINNFNTKAVCFIDLLSYCYTALLLN